eukprot:666289-Amphidinium_carterae.1
MGSQRTAAHHNHQRTHLWNDEKFCLSPERVENGFLPRFACQELESPPALQLHTATCAPWRGSFR